MKQALWFVTCKFNLISLLFFILIFLCNRNILFFLLSYIKRQQRLYFCQSVYHNSIMFYKGIVDDTMTTMKMIFINLVKIH